MFHPPTAKRARRDNVPPAHTFTISRNGGAAPPEQGHGGQHFHRSYSYADIVLWPRGTKTMTTGESLRVSLGQLTITTTKKSFVENMDFSTHPLGCGTVWDCTCSKVSLGLGRLTLFGFHCSKQLPPSPPHMRTGNTARLSSQFE